MPCRTEARTAAFSCAQIVAVPYGELMDVLERLRIGGYYKIALVALEGVPDNSAQTSPASVKP